MTTEMTILEDDGFEYPSYRDKGDITVRLVRKDGKLVVIDYAYDSGACPLYVVELGIEYWFEEMADHTITEEGDWTFVGVHGHYSRGDGWETDDDVEFYVDEVRPATDEERLSLS